MKYAVLPRLRRKVLWAQVFSKDERVVVFYGLEEARQVLVWHQLWRRGQALMPMLPPVTVGAALDTVLSALEGG